MANPASSNLTPDDEQPEHGDAALAFAWRDDRGAEALYRLNGDSSSVG